MKRKMICLLSIILILATNAFAVDLIVDGKPLTPDVEPMLENGRVLVPVRTIFESIGATVSWDNASRSATAYKGGTTVTLTIDSQIAYVNGTPKTLDVPARIVNGRTLVPARFVAEAMDASVWWENETSTAYVATTTNYDGYRLAPDVVYSTTGEENGLADSFMYIDATAITYNKANDGILTYVFQTSEGNFIINTATYLMPPGWEEIQIGSKYRVCFLYMGFSSVYQAPAGMFMELGDLSATPYKAGQTTPPTPTTPPATPTTPVTPTEPTKPTEPDPSPQGNTVYITKTGKRYHYDSNCNGGTYYASTLSEAKARGLTPCNKCAK